MYNFYYILLCKIVYIWGGKNQILVFSVYPRTVLMVTGTRN